MSERNKWLVVFLYAAAMAWVESAVVFYLRTLVGRIDPYQAYPLPVAGGLGAAELVREAATLLMLLTVGILAGRTWRCRLDYAAIAFGLWDILYYVFLKVICGWPHAITDWDILFLLPLPWWGPVWAPVSIAVLMVLWGTLVTQFGNVSVAAERKSERAMLGAAFRHVRQMGKAERVAWGLNLLGIFLALYVFMADALRVSGQGPEALRRLLPVEFNWPLFCLALLLMSSPVVQCWVASTGGWSAFRNRVRA